jgi:hypothetical protein
MTAVADYFGELAASEATLQRDIDVLIAKENADLAAGVEHYTAVTTFSHAAAAAEAAHKSRCYAAAAKHGVDAAHMQTPC